MPLLKHLRAYDADAGDWRRFEFVDAKVHYSECNVAELPPAHRPSKCPCNLVLKMVWRHELPFPAPPPPSSPPLAARNLVASDDKTYSLILMCWNPNRFRCASMQLAPLGKQSVFV